MRTTTLAALFAVVAANASASDLAARVEPLMPDLLATYRQLHAAPELSQMESRTSEFIAKKLKNLGYEVHTKIGKYQQPNLVSYGVVAILKNGEGPRVLVRTDLDGLPVTEQTGLSYASTVKTKDLAGNVVGVTHACGHDLHMTSFLGTAQLLAEMKDRWRGTIMLIGQPAEEIGAGASAMLADGLYERFGTPDFIVALHDDPEVAAGKVATVPGFAMSALNSVDILVRGVGAHGSRPEAGKDPIVISAQIINALQTIVSREVSPLDQAVVTVGSIHGGTKRNIIPDEVTLLLTVRTYKEEVRQKVLASIARIAEHTARAAGVPDDRLPVVTVSKDEVSPPVYNDPGLSARLTETFKAELGADNVTAVPPMMASEDVGRFSLEGKIPAVLYRLGASDPAALANSLKTGVPLPGLHSPQFAPIPEPAIRAGVRSMTAAVLDLLKAPAAK